MRSAYVTEQMLDVPRRLQCSHRLGFSSPLGNLDGQLRERALTDQRKAVEREDRGVRRRVRVRLVMLVLMLVLAMDV